MGKAAEKTARVMAALEHREADRVPIGEFFWTNFLRRAKAENSLDQTFDPYRHWDLDYMVVNPNMDPFVTGIQTLEDNDYHKLVKTGFGATIQRRRDLPMPHYDKFEWDTPDKVLALNFDDPADPRRYFEAIDDQINCVGDDLLSGIGSYMDRFNAYKDDFCMFGGVCEPHEFIWRIMGTENVLVLLMTETEKMRQIIEKLGEFLAGMVEHQVKATEGGLQGIYIWGDIAFDHGMFFSPDFWREAYLPQLKRICDTAHKHGLKTIYHGCGDARPVYAYMMAAGVDCYNPLEAKAGLDVVDLKREYNGRLAFCGNIDVRVLATNDRDKVRAEVLRKLNAARGGGYILQSDHSMPDNVDFATYDYMIKLAREHGNFPLDLGEFNESIESQSVGGMA